MRRALVPLLALSLLAAGVAQAQMSGPGGGGRGHRGGNGTPGGASDGTKPATAAPAQTKATPVDQLDIVGVVTQLGPEPDRLTIRYDAVEGMNWPAGVKPFEVAKSALLKNVAVGEKVRFRLESQQIAALAPF